ncbi:MAG: FG-GAP repeat protein [Chloroflexi bacterium]|nr:FG-GAP repeat protein [Chloroflexota bacterium]
MFRMALVFRSPLNALVVLALLLSSVWLPPAASLSIPTVEWPWLGSAPVAEEAISPVSNLSPGLATSEATAQPPAGIPPERWAAIRETIRRDMYSIAASESGYLAENPAQKLNLAFDSEGLTVRPAPRMRAPGARDQGPSFAEASAEGDRQWTWGLALVGYGYAGDIRPVSAATVSTQDNRVTYSRGDGSGAPLLDEWYVNEQRGLEHGFTVFQPPDTGGRERAGQMVALDLRLRGNLVPALVDNRGSEGHDAAQSIAFLAEGAGTILRYGELHVEDATGKALPSRLTIVSPVESAGQAIRILVDDADAKYPLVVDPLIHSQVKALTPSDPAIPDTFGWSVAVGGDTIVVGARWKGSMMGTSVGAAYVFARNQGGADNWGEVKKLSASDGASNDTFGESVAIDGNSIVVGANGNSSNQGAAYVFARNQGGADNWGEVKKLTASDAATGDYFGFSVAVDGDTIVVGAYRKSNIQGAAYVFARNLGGADFWGEVKKLTASDAAAGDEFGFSVAIDGDAIAVGAESKSGQGAAYVFARNLLGGADVWGQVQKLTASDGAAFDHFGGSVAIDGDTVVVGASGNDVSHNNQGAAYVFARNLGGADSWGEVKKLTASDAAANDSFGGVGIDGDTIVVGATGKSAGQGAVYVFARNLGGADSWGQTQKLTASDGAALDGFGRVAIDGDTIVIGSPLKFSLQGAAYVFVRQGNIWQQSSQPSASDAAPGDDFGISVAIHGDTIVVGAYGQASNQGAAYVFVRNQGGANNWGQVKKLMAADAAANDNFGYSVAIDGDTIVVGAYLKSSGAGAAYVFARNQSGADSWGQVQKLTASDAAANDNFGYSVAIDRVTIVVGAYSKTTMMGPNLGASYVFARNENGPDNWGQVKKLTASDAATGDYFGESVAMDGDTIVVGADGKASNQGAAYVFVRNQGGADFWGQVKKLTASDAATGDYFGDSVAMDGDTIVVGANGKASNQGAAYVFARNRGGADSWDQVTKLTASDAGANDYFGGSVAMAGDTIVVGAYANSSGQGAAYAFDRNQGGADFWGEKQKLTASNAAHFGVSVAIADNIDGDTIVVGADETSGIQGAAYPASSNRGAAFMYVSQTYPVTYTVYLPAVLR